MPGPAAGPGPQRAVSWRQHAGDAVRTYLLSPEFASSLQVATGEACLVALRASRATCTAPAQHTGSRAGSRTGPGRAGVFIACLFVFVQQLRFASNDILGVGVVIGLMRVSSGITAGACRHRQGMRGWALACLHSGHASAGCTTSLTAAVHQARSADGHEQAMLPSNGQTAACCHGQRVVARKPCCS